MSVQISIKTSLKDLRIYAFKAFKEELYNRSHIESLRGALLLNIRSTYLRLPGGAFSALIASHTHRLNVYLGGSKLLNDRYVHRKTN